MNKYKYRKTGYLSIFLAAVFFSGLYNADGYSEQAKTLTWEDCVKAAELNNPDIISAKEKILQYAAERNIIRADLLPQITASVTGDRSRNETGKSSSYYYSITARQLIFDGFKSLYDLKSADADLDGIKLDYRITSARVRYDLRISYIGYIKAGEMLRIAEEIEARREHIYELVKMRYNAGKEHIGSLHSTEADLMQSKADTAEARRSLELANTTLCHLLGYDETVQVSIEDTLDVSIKADTQPDFTLLAAGNPSVLKAATARDSAYYSLESSWLDYSPKLYGTASAGRGGDSVNDMSNQWSVGFEISLPLFEGGKTYYGEEKASAVYRQAEADGKSAKNTVIETLHDAWNTLRNSLDAVEVAKLSLKAAIERSTIGEMQYSIGTLTFDSWTIIENNLASMKMSYISACATALVSEAAWIQSKGGTLEDESKN